VSQLFLTIFSHNHVDWDFFIHETSLLHHMHGRIAECREGCSQPRGGWKKMGFQDMADDLPWCTNSNSTHQWRKKCSSHTTVHSLYPGFSTPQSLHGSCAADTAHTANTATKKAQDDKPDEEKEKKGRVNTLNLLPF
jgi:hypothetical protein